MSQNPPARTQCQWQKWPSFFCCSRNRTATPPARSPARRTAPIWQQMVGNFTIHVEIVAQDGGQPGQETPVYQAPRDAIETNGHGQHRVRFAEQFFKFCRMADGLAWRIG